MISDLRLMKVLDGLVKGEPFDDIAKSVYLPFHEISKIRDDFPLFGGSSFLDRIKHKPGKAFRRLLPKKVRKRWRARTEAFSSGAIYLHPFRNNSPVAFLWPSRGI